MERKTNWNLPIPTGPRRDFKDAISVLLLFFHNLKSLNQYLLIQLQLSDCAESTE